MRIEEGDVRRAAASARLSLSDARVAALTAELAPIAVLLAPLHGVRPDINGGAVGVGAGGMPLRSDEGPAYQMTRPFREIAPVVRAGYVLIPRASADAAADPATGDGDPVADVLGDDALRAEMELEPRG